MMLLMHLEKRVKKLEEHLKKDHNHGAVSAYLKEVVYGGIDGIITTFAVVAGFSGAALSNETTTQLSFVVVLLFGLANLFADGVSMGLGNFLAVRSDQRLYCSIRAKEQDEIQNNPEYEAEETVTILMQKGFSEEDARTLTAIYRKNESYWTDFMMNHELEVPDPTDESPFKTGFATFVSFLFFGFVPLIPFVVFGSFDPQTVFQFSAGGAFVALVLLGVLRWRAIDMSLTKSVVEVVLIGGVAASIAFFVGSLFTF